MNIQILHSWLLEYLDTNATPTKLGEYLSLCGPSVERIEKHGNDWLYDIEVTTNRVDCMSVYGIAREAAVILPQFGIKASLKPLNAPKPSNPKTSFPLIVKSNDKLVKRTIGIVLGDIKNWKTPEWMKVRLEASGIRSLNAVVDVTNYVMTEVGHPCHVFDYDLIKGHTIIIRESKKGEKIVGLDNKAYSLPEGSIVFDDGTGEIIDLPGIIGTKNSVVNENTKTILFEIESNDPIRIRKASMTTGIRTVAATLNEKGVDPELAEVALLRGIQLYKEVCQAEVVSKIYDHYPKPYSAKTVSVKKEFIDERLGVEVSKSRIDQILSDLEFGVKWKRDTLTVTVPSFRALDVDIPEDIVEEVARIYGYHNLPSILMTGLIPDPLPDAPFQFELKTKRILQMLGSIEVYTLSLVSLKEATKAALKLRNPLGSDSEYLRTSLAPSLVRATKENAGEKEPFHLFELANVYLPKKNSLPEEKMTLAGIFANASFRYAKGIVEQLLSQLHVDYTFELTESPIYLSNTAIKIMHGKNSIGTFGQLENTDIRYYEFDAESLRKAHVAMPKYKSIPKYPAQVEDITISIPQRVKVGDVIESFYKESKLISYVDLQDVYEGAYTFRISYQDPEKTLTDQEVEKVRTQILHDLKKKFGVSVK